MIKMDDLRIPPFLQQIIVIAVIFVAIIGMKYSSEILGPILLSVFISIIIYPILKWLEKRGLSYNQSVVVTLVATFALGLSILWFLAFSLIQLIKQLPSLTKLVGYSSQYGKTNKILSATSPWEIFQDSWPQEFSCCLPSSSWYMSFLK
jgi:predicted PurR-regulated permease PerM